MYTFIHFTQVEHYKYLNTISGGGVGPFRLASLAYISILSKRCRAMALELSFFTILPRVFSFVDSECISSAYSSESSSSMCAVSGSKLDVELCVALRLCLYAVNTSEARTFIKSRLVPNAFISLLKSTFPTI